MRKPLDMTLVVALTFVACSCCPRLGARRPAFSRCSMGQMVARLDQDIQRAKTDPGFLDQATFEGRWELRTRNWDALLLELERRARAAKKTQPTPAAGASYDELAGHAAMMRALVTPLPGSVRLYRESTLDRLAGQLEALKRAYRATKQP